MPALRPLAVIVGCLLIAQMAWCSTERSVTIPLFEDWLRSNNFFPRAIAYDVTRGVMVAQEPIPADVVVEIPRRLVVSVDTVRESPMRICLDNNVGLTHAECVALYFLSEILNPASHWKPWFDTFPRDLTYLPYYWPDDDLKQLQALEKPVRSKAETQRASIDTTYVKLQQFIALHPDLFPDPALYTREMWEWAVLIFFTRSFAYTVPDTSCLMPWNDLFNHADRWTAPEMRAYSQLWNTNKDLVVRWNKTFDAGEEVQSIYSTVLSSAELLYQYGFVPKGGQYTVDYVDSMVSIYYEHDPNKEAKAAMIAQLAAGPGGNRRSIYFLQQGLSAAMLAALRISELTPPQFAQVQKDNLTASDFLDHIYSADNERVLSTRVLRIADSLLSLFPTTAAEDNELLRTPIENTHVLYAIACRKYYKDILINTQRQVRVRWQSLLPSFPTEK